MCLLFCNLYSSYIASVCCAMILDTEDASEGETEKKEREFTGIKEQYAEMAIMYI